LCLAGIIIVLKIFPDPERSSVEGSEVVTDYEFLAVLIVSSNGFLISLGEGPLERFLVDITTSISNLVSLMEIGILIAIGNMN
jgi:hypothetical protein